MPRKPRSQELGTVWTSKSNGSNFYSFDELKVSVKIKHTQQSFQDTTQLRARNIEWKSCWKIIQIEFPRHEIFIDSVSANLLFFARFRFRFFGLKQDKFSPFFPFLKILRIRLSIWNSISESSVVRMLLCSVH